MSIEREVEVVILAAGKGTRTLSRQPKPALRIGGKAMIEHVLEAAQGLCGEPFSPIVVYSATTRDAIESSLDNRWPNVRWAEQKRQDGTAGALQSALAEVTKERILVLYADVPLVRSKTLRALLDCCPKGGMAVLSMELDDPAGYGRIVRDNTQKVLQIVEERDASKSYRKIKEVNSGIMALDTDRCRELLHQIPERQTKERDLPDMVMAVTNAKGAVHTHLLEDPREVQGANTRAQIHALEQVNRSRRANQLMDMGVSLADASRIDVRGTVVAKKDVWLDINVVLEGHVEIGENVQIGAGCVIRNSTIEDGVEIRPYSVIDGAVLGAGSVVGPFARLRLGAKLGEQAFVGNFVEVKQAKLGKGAKASHLAYLGDCSVGEQTNIGAGTIVCNFDGEKKHFTEIGNNSFIGSNSTLVSPVKVGDEALVGAGSVVTKELPTGEMAIGRSRQKNMPKRPRLRRKAKNT